MHPLLPGLHLPRHHPRSYRSHTPLRPPEAEVGEIPVSGGGGQADRLVEQPKMADGRQREFRRRRGRRAQDPRGTPYGGAPRAPVGTPPPPPPRPADSSLVAAADDGNRDSRPDVDDGQPDPAVGGETEWSEVVRTEVGREGSSQQFRRGRSHTSARRENSVFDSGAAPQRAPVLLSRTEISDYTADQQKERRTVMRNSESNYF